MRKKESIKTGQERQQSRYTKSKTKGPQNLRKIPQKYAYFGKGFSGFCNRIFRRTTPHSATPGLRPVIHIPNYMDHYSFTDP